MRPLSLTVLCALTLTSASCTLFQRPETAADPYAGQTGQENPYGAYGSTTQPSYGSAAQPNPYTTAQTNPYGAPPNPYPQTNPYSTQPSASANPYSQQAQPNPYGSYETPQTYPAQSGGGTYQQPYVQSGSTPSYSGGSGSTGGGGSRTHTVVQGDSLSKLARQYKTTVNAIKQANGLTNDTIVLGKTLVIP